MSSSTAPCVRRRSAMQAGHVTDRKLPIVLRDYPGAPVRVSYIVRVSVRVHQLGHQGRR